MPRRAQEDRKIENGMQVSLYGSGRWAPVRETAGMSARSLSEHTSCWCVPCLLLIGGAGQGAHREVGSEGFEAKHRAVADIGEPVGPIQVMPSPHYGGEGSTWGTWAQQGVCGRRGGKVLALPREVSYGPARRGWVAGRISREVKSSVMPCEKSE